MQLTKIRHGSQPVQYLQEPLLGVGEGVNYYFKVMYVYRQDCRVSARFGHLRSEG